MVDPLHFLICMNELFNSLVTVNKSSNVLHTAFPHFKIPSVHIQWHNTLFCLPLRWQKKSPGRTSLNCRLVMIPDQEIGWLTLSISIIVHWKSMINICHILHLKCSFKNKTFVKFWQHCSPVQKIPTLLLYYSYRPTSNLSILKATLS